MKVEVRGEPLPMQLPSLDDLEKVAAFRQEDVPDDNEINDSSREIEFNMGANFYHVNGNVFDEQRIDHTVSVNTAEEWKLTSRRGIHPFHIHVNAFAVKPDRPDDPWIWRDTFVVSRDAPVIIRTRFLDFDGDTVLHCHNLVHEDLGMMQRIKLQKVLPQEGIRAEGTSFRDGLAPQWRAFDQEGREWSSDQYRGKRVLLVLHRGIECLHCAEQLTRLKQDEFKLRSFGLKVITICPKLPDKPIIGGVFADYPFPILVDESRDVFRLYNCLDKAKAPMHGLFLLDSYNNIVFSTRTELAVEDPVGWVLEKLNPQSLRAKQ